MSTQFKSTFADMPADIAHYFPDCEIPEGAARVGCIQPEKKPPVDPAPLIISQREYDIRWRPFVELAANGCLESQHALYIRDCLRAGHKYGQSELVILPDNIATRFAPYMTDTMSITGSHGAMCASIA